MWNALRLDAGYLIYIGEIYCFLSYVICYAVVIVHCVNKIIYIYKYP